MEKERKRKKVKRRRRKSRRKTPRRKKTVFPSRPFFSKRRAGKNTKKNLRRRISFFFYGCPCLLNRPGPGIDPGVQKCVTAKKNYWSTFFLAAKKMLWLARDFFLPVTRVYFSATVAQITVGPLSHFRQEALKKWLSGRLGSAR